MREQGHTLIGLLLTLAITSTLVLIAHPSFSGVLERVHRQASVDALYEALWFARSSAVTQQKAVVMAARADQWQAGWEIFLDSNGDGHRQRDERLLREKNALPAYLAITTNQGIGRAVHYHPDGHARKPGGALQMGRFEICVAGGAQAIILNAFGRPRVDPVEPSDC